MINLGWTQKALRRLSLGRHDYGPRPAGKSFEWLIQEAANDAAERLAAAGVTPQPEPEYESAVGAVLGDKPGRYSVDEKMPTLDDALEELEYALDSGTFSNALALRRVKAGAWEPVPNQSDGDS